MNDQYTEVSYVSWGTRLKNAIFGVLFGLVLFIGAFPLLMWNEGRALATLESIEEAEGAFISIEAVNISAANDGKLVYVTGDAVTEESISDKTFGISVKGLKLNRIVQMYQWDESVSEQREKQLGGSEKVTTTYSYNKTWSSSQNDSSRFNKPGYDNPIMAYGSQSFMVSKAFLGDFKLSHSILREINRSSSLAINSLVSDAKLKKLKGHRYQGGIYIGADPSTPQIGDLKISYQVVEPQSISLISGQSGVSFSPFITSNGRQIEIVSEGIVAANNLFQQEKFENTLITWGIRVGGALAMMFGIGLLLGPVVTFADVVPMFGSIVGLGVNIIAFVIGLICALVTIAIAWIFVRPIIGSILIGISLLLFFSLFRRKNKKG